jgi:hypothetical protein
MRDEFVETRSTAATDLDATVSSISTVDSARRASRRVSRYFKEGGYTGVVHQYRLLFDNDLVWGR